MREQINEDMLEEINGGAIYFKWDAATQSGIVSSNITGQTLKFGPDKFQEVFSYVRKHSKDADATQMNDLISIING